MTGKKICLYIQAVLCALICLLLSMMVVRIYREGIALRMAGDLSTWIFTREKVTERVLPILPLILASVSFTIVIAVKGFRDENADKPVKDIESTRDLLCSQISEPTEAMSRERGMQKKLRLAGLISALVCLVPVLIYMLNGSHFESTEDLEGMIGQLMLHVLPWVAIGFGALIFTELKREKIIERECDEARAIIKESGVKNKKEDQSSPDKGRINAIRGCVMAAAAVLILFGIYNGSMRDVFVKAVKICTECIGLG